MPEATLLAVKDYFGYPSLSAFSKDWKQLSETERTQIRTGIGDGSFTY
jgi:hypothetical protein